jgi:four helix bundle protein
MLLEELNVYRMAMELGNDVWTIVFSWDYFERSTIGKQLVECTDSIAANISEGFGRYHYKDARNFFYYARGSISESKTWIKKAHSRNLIEHNRYQELLIKLDHTQAMLNSLIRSTGKKTS